MNYIIDTHIFLWSIVAPKKVSRKVKTILLDPHNTIQISCLTFWEIALKYQLGKLSLKNITPDSLPAIAQESGFKILNLDPETASSFYKLPKKKNKDPFDRMLVWQAIQKDLILITKDKHLADYKSEGLQIVWCAPP